MSKRGVTAAGPLPSFTGFPIKPLGHRYLSYLCYLMKCLTPLICQFFIADLIPLGSYQDNTFFLFLSLSANISTVSSLV